MKVYICGDKSDRKRFKQAERMIKEEGNIPINPVRVIYALPPEVNKADFTIVAYELIHISDRKDETMTEKEAIIRFEFIRCALLGGTKPHIAPNKENIALIDVAIKALKEVQQYRALETEVEKYRQIGTVEECQKWKEQKKGRTGSHD